MKGILLAGGKGSRLYPITKVTNKHLIPVYDKPLIYYSFSMLMLAGIRDILIIAREEDLVLYKELFNDGHGLGCNISYTVQQKPNGIAEAFILGESFIGNDSVMLVLGDNIFVKENIENKLLTISQQPINGAVIFAKHVNNPKAYGVIEFDSKNKVIDIIEKPTNPRSNLVAPGLYFYDNSVIGIAKKIIPSGRNELEITDVNREYIKMGLLKAERLDCLWFDAGDVENLFLAAEVIRSYEKRIGKKMACIEEIALRNGWINGDTFKEHCEEYKNSYGEYLRNINIHEID